MTNIFKDINWKVRFMNKTWVLAFVAALFILISAILETFGVHIDMTNIQKNVTDIIYAVFGVLAVIGVVIDGTTPDFKDSDRALTYDQPGRFSGGDDVIEEEDEQ